MTYEETKSFLTGLSKELGLHVVQARVHTNFYIHSPYLTYQVDGSPGYFDWNNYYCDLAVIMEPKEMTVYSDAYLNSEKTGIVTGRGLIMPYSDADQARIRKAVTSLMAKVESLSQQLSQQLERQSITKTQEQLEELLNCAV